MAMVSEALKIEETRVGQGRTVAGVVNSIETLEGGGFLVRRFQTWFMCSLAPGNA